MRIIYLLSVYFSFFLLSNALGQNPDSLKRVIGTSNLSGIEQAHINFQIAQTYYELDEYDSVLKYSDKAINTFKLLNNQNALKELLWLQSKSLKKQGFNTRLLVVHQELIQLLEKHTDSVGLMGAYDKMGIYYYHMGVIDSAIYYYNRAYDIGKLINDKKALMDSYNNISQVFNYQGNYSMELEYLIKGLEMAISENDDDGKATFYHNIALSYLNQQQFDSALININKAFAINTRIKETNRIAKNKTAMGNIYAHQGEVQKAMVYFNEALSYFSYTGNLYGQIEANYNLGYSHFYLEDYIPSQKYYFEALRIANIIDLVSYKVDLYDGLYEVYYFQGDHKKALVYYKKNRELQDSISKSTNVALVTKLQAEYEYGRHITEIELLSKENELRNKQVYNTIVIAIISSISLILVIILVIKLFRKLKKNQYLNQQLLTQNEDIKVSHTRLEAFENDIRNDLKYAKDLQYSFFNDPKNFKTIFEEFYFKAYTSRDLNNSFLWSNKLGNKVYWAVVTIGNERLKGAFTLMYVYSMLNRVYYEKKYSGVEDFTKKFISSSFGENKNLDWGKIQMVFCSLDHKKNELQFVNIGIDVELIRNTRVWEFKADQLLIDKQNADAIISNKIQLQSNDHLLFFCKNWCKEEESISAGKTIYNDTVTTKTTDHKDFVKELENSDDVEDFIFLSLTR